MSIIYDNVTLSSSSRVSFSRIFELHYLSSVSSRFVNLKCISHSLVRHFNGTSPPIVVGGDLSAESSSELGSRQYLLSVNCFRNEINKIFLHASFFEFLPDNLPIKINCLSTLLARVRHTRTTGSKVYLNQVMRPQKEGKENKNYC